MRIETDSYVFILPLLKVFVIWNSINPFDVNVFTFVVFKNNQANLIERPFVAILGGLQKFQTRSVLSKT